MFLRRGSRHFLISIHAPREGGDTFPGFRTLASSAFQSTPPARGATVKHIERRCYADHFNPRPPRGGRLSVLKIKPTMALFQSTPPARGATHKRRGPQKINRISIHAPREGGDPTRPSSDDQYRYISIHAPREGGDQGPRTKHRQQDTNFNPRPPRGGRPVVW